MAEQKKGQSQKGSQHQKGAQPPAASSSGRAGRAVLTSNIATAADMEASKKAPPARLRGKYQNDVIPGMMKQFSYKNPMQVPHIQKVVVNIGLGEAIANARAQDAAFADLASITGQKPVVNRAKKSIAAFKLREGMPIGVSVTLRGNRMYEFLDRLINIGLPRVRDFTGVPKRFDGHGNYTLGLKEQIIFPEIDYDKVDKVRGMEISIVTSATTDQEGMELLRLLGMPFRK